VESLAKGAYQRREGFSREAETPVQAEGLRPTDERLIPQRGGTWKCSAI